MKIGHIDKIIVILLMLLLIVDSLNGFLMFNRIKLPISISQFFKLPLLFFMIFRILIINSTFFLHILFIVFMLLLSIIFNYMNGIDINLIDEIIQLLKLLVIPISMYYFVVVKDIDSEWSFNVMLRVFKVSFTVLVINIFMSVIGLGYSSYSGGLGNKGFFYAGNELSILYFVLSTFLLQYVYSRYDKKRYVLFSLTTLLLGVLISTKVSMFSVALLIIFIPISSVKYELNTKFLLKSLFFIFSVTIVSSLFYDNFVNSKIFARWAYFFKVYDYNWVSILISGRNRTLIEAFNMNSEYFEPINALLGYTKTGFLHYMYQSSIYKGKANEMDFFDIYFMYGIIGLISILSIWIVAVYNYVITPNKNVILLLTVFILLFVSFLSGHILYSGLSGPFIGMYLSLLFRKNKNYI